MQVLLYYYCRYVLYKQWKERKGYYYYILLVVERFSILS